MTAQETARRTERLLNQAKISSEMFAKAREEFYASIRKAAAAEATRTQIAEAVGLSRTRVQQIIRGYNR